MGLRLDTWLDDHWHPAYIVRSETVPEINFEVANWYTSRHPQSQFRHNLMVAHTTEDTYYSLPNYRFTVRTRGAELVKQMLDTAGLMETLSTLVLLPVEPAWQQRQALLTKEQNKEKGKGPVGRILSGPHLKTIITERRNPGPVPCAQSPLSADDIPCRKESRCRSVVPASSGLRPYDLFPHTVHPDIP